MIPLLITDDSSESRQVYCIEAGIRYSESDKGYISQNGENSDYFRNLPVTAQYGIMLTSVYGWQPGKSSPVSGTNEDDYAVATQIILWEYQQQLRTDPAKIGENSYGIQADNFFKTIQGRPAEKCYDWILKQTKRHNIIPSFCANKASEEDVYKLKYNQESENYSLTITDTNNTLADLKFTGSDDIKVKRDGNKYTFTSDKMLTDAFGRVRDCMESAKNNRIIATNPCFDIRVPPENKKIKRRFLTVEEQNIFLRQAQQDNDWYTEMYYIMFLTGLRVGEVGGLQWDDVNFEQKCIKISRSLSCQYEKGVKKWLLLHRKLIIPTEQYRL